MSVSVVIPALNAGDFIVRAIDSALSQGRVLHEVIVVDDGSTDDTGAVVSDISRRDARVRLVKLPMNQGPGPARNAGFATATGDWIAILDADDVYLPGRLDYLVEKAEQFNLDFAADNILFFDHTAHRVSRIGIRPEMIGAVLYVNRYAFVKNCCGTSDAKVDFGLLQPIVRTSFLRKQNLSYPPIRHGEDFAFCLEGLLAGGRFGVFPEAYYMVTERTGSISGKSSPLTRTTVDFGGMERHAREMAELAQANGDRELAELLLKRANHMLRMSLIRQVKNHWKSRQLHNCARLVCTDRRALTACFEAGFRKDASDGSKRGPGTRKCMRQIAIFRSELLRVSETFILAQANSLHQYTPHFVGLRRAGRSLPLPDGAVILGSGRYSAALKAKVYAGFPVAPFFHRRIARLGASVIHAHFAPDGALAVSVAERLGIPLVVTLHGYDVTIKTDFQKRYGKLWRKADRFICVSEFIRKKAIEAGFPPEKLVVHYIGIDRKRFAPADSDRTEGMVLFVGRLVEKKGCSYLLRAMQRVQNRHIKARLVIIGDGPLRKSLEQCAQELKLDCNFLGAQSQDVVRKNLQSASVLCVPSVAARNGDSEGLPITILEALCMKVPVVASRHAGIPEAVLDGETGLLAGERDEKELAEQILRFLADEALRNACIRRGSDWIATQFDLIRQTSLLEDIYTNVASAQ